VLGVERRALLGLGAAVQAHHSRAGRRRPGRVPPRVASRVTSLVARRVAGQGTVEPPGQCQPVPPGERLERGHQQRLPGQPGHPGEACPLPAGGVEAPQLAGPGRPLHRDHDGAPVTGQHRAAGDVAGQAGHLHPLVGASVEQLQLAAPGDVPDQQQQPARVVGVQPLQLGVLAGGEDTALPPPAVRTERHGDQRPAGQTRVRGEVGDQVPLTGRGRAQQRGDGGAGGRVRQQRMVGVGVPVDDDAELPPARAVLKQDQPLTDRHVEHADEPADRQRLPGAGGRVDQHRPCRCVRGGGERHRDPVTAARPRAEVGVRAPASGDPPGAGAVGAHHPHLRAHAPVGGDGAGEPPSVSRPAHGHDRVVGQPQRGGRGLPAGDDHLLDPQLRTAPTVADEGDPPRVPGHVRPPAPPGVGELVPQPHRPLDPAGLDG
jgi:hypothetical protein